MRLPRCRLAAWLAAYLVGCLVARLVPPGAGYVVPARLAAAWCRMPAGASPPRLFPPGTDGGLPSRLCLAQDGWCAWHPRFGCLAARLPGCLAGAAWCQLGGAGWCLQEAIASRARFASSANGAPRNKEGNGRKVPVLQLFVRPAAIRFSLSIGATWALGFTPLKQRRGGQPAGQGRSQPASQAAP